MIFYQSKHKLIEDREKCVNLLVALGFIINKEKFSMIPTQKITYKRMVGRRLVFIKVDVIVTTDASIKSFGPVLGPNFFKRDGMQIRKKCI